MDKDYCKLLDDMLKSISINLEHNNDPRGIHLTYSNIVSVLLNSQYANNGELFFTDFELKSTIDKLVKDKYLHETISETGFYYRPTTEGFIFIQEGMYQSKRQK